MQVRMEIADDWNLQASSRQCARTHIIVSSWISGEVQSYASSVSLFSRFVTLWFLRVPKIKIYNQGLSFSNADSVQRAVTEAFNTLTETGFQSWYEAWKILWAKRVASEGCYFEGDIIDLDE
jgi:hypothetical protein